MGEERRTLGWRLDPGERAALLTRFPPRWAEIVADHVTLASGVSPEQSLPEPAQAVIVGEADDGEGVQAMVVRIGGTTDRPDGSTYHVTWSLAPGRRAKESNDVIARLGWTPLATPAVVTLTPARLR